MTFFEMLFSFKGRISRSTYWGVCFALLGIEAICFFLLDITETILSNVDYKGSNDISFLLFLILTGFIIWSVLAITIKRWHDRDKSDWWWLIGYIPIIGPLWSTIELGFMKGTDGKNNYGDRAY